jgi:predicted site-specific integrase-resolvase
MSNKKFITSKKATEILGIHINTLRNWEANNQIESIRTPGNTRLYNIDSFLLERSTELSSKRNICYSRVSSRPQLKELENQVEFLKSKYPSHDVIKDIGSGLNYKRKGLQSILELAMQGNLGEVVVAHKDRLCRFGIELIQFIIESSGGSLVVLDSSENSPEQEMVKDLTSIIHVFSCRLHGLRKYKTKIKEAASNKEE